MARRHARIAVAIATSLLRPYYRCRPPIIPLGVLLYTRGRRESECGPVCLQVLKSILHAHPLYPPCAASRASPCNKMVICIISFPPAIREAGYTHAHNTHLTFTSRARRAASGREHLTSSHPPVQRADGRHALFAEKSTALNQHSRSIESTLSHTDKNSRRGA